MNTYTESPFGPVKISCEDGFLIALNRVDQIGDDHCPSPAAEQVKVQLQEYFSGRRTTFDLPLRPRGTPFQLAVWAALRKIPYGHTQSYKDIALAIGKPGASRAVGMACNRNPIWVITPCHRVIGSSGALTGYAGGLATKHALLEMEARNRSRSQYHLSFRN